MIVVDKHLAKSSKERPVKEFLSGLMAKRKTGAGGYPLPSSGEDEEPQAQKKKKKEPALIPSVRVSAPPGGAASTTSKTTHPPTGPSSPRDKPAESKTTAAQVPTPQHTPILQNGAALWDELGSDAKEDMPTGPVVATGSKGKGRAFKPALVNDLTTTVERLSATVDDLKLTNEHNDEKLSLVLETITKLSLQASNPALDQSTPAEVEKNDLSAYLKNPPITPELTDIIERVVIGARDRVGRKDKSALHNSVMVREASVRLGSRAQDDVSNGSR
ncbi:hypothetical protein BDV93DRAFT_570628 [Ceratobasidium sp. AG-I]|nr:hypothetical protein BDV93DRAFT_570628 [Ceratobasidium sp. AG-I]